MPDTAIDNFIDTFDDLDAPTQERVMDGLRLVQRLAKRRAGRNNEPWLNHSLAVQPPIDPAPARIPASETVSQHDARLDRQMAEQAAEAESVRPRLVLGKPR